MTPTEHAVLDALRDLESAVEKIRTDPGISLLPIFDRIDALTRQLPRDTDPTLLHYLHKRSYQKARLFLEGNDGANAAGNCGHV